MGRFGVKRIKFSELDECKYQKHTHHMYLKIKCLYLSLLLIIFTLSLNWYKITALTGITKFKFKHIFRSMIFKDYKQINLKYTHIYLKPLGHF